MKISSFPYEIRVFLLWSKTNGKKIQAYCQYTKHYSNVSICVQKILGKTEVQDQWKRSDSSLGNFPIFNTHTYTHLNFRAVPNISFPNKSPNLLSSLNPSSPVHTAAHFHPSSTGQNIFLSTSDPAVLMCNFIVHVTKKKQRY